MLGWYFRGSAVFRSLCHRRRNAIAGLPGPRRCRRLLSSLMPSCPPTAGGVRKLALSHLSSFGRSRKVRCSSSGGSPEAQSGRGGLAMAHTGLAGSRKGVDKRLREKIWCEGISSCWPMSAEQPCCSPHRNLWPVPGVLRQIGQNGGHSQWPALRPSQSLDSSLYAPWRATCRTQQLQHGPGSLLLAPPVQEAAWRSPPLHPPPRPAATPA